MSQNIACSCYINLKSKINTTERIYIGELATSFVVAVVQISVKLNLKCQRSSRTCKMTENANSFP